MLYYEQKLHRVNWKHKLPAVWVVLWTMVCVSDFIVSKRYKWVGYVMLFAVGFFFFMWNNLKKPEKVVDEFMSGILWNYLVNIAFCVICRPETDGVRYAGGFLNPVSFGRYLTVVLIVILCRIDQKIMQKVKISHLLPEIALGIICCILQWKTQSRSGMIPAMVAGILFFIKQIYQKTMKKQMMQLILSTMILLMPMSMLIDFGVHTVPYLLHTQVKFEKDYYSAVSEETNSIWFEKVYAADTETGENNWLTNSRVYRSITEKKSLEAITSERTLYWKAYLREMNLFGHCDKLELWGSKRSAHNGILQMIYFYGVLTIIPYSLLYVLFFKGACNVWKEGKKEALFFMAGSISSILVMLVENMELSFQMLDWYTLHLTLGYFFIKYDEKRGNEA